ncbi:Zinc finger protein 706 [Exaiptasia diaphana]|nr:Zinc finger protein 706 [Exaiptasia diaphana]
MTIILYRNILKNLRKLFLKWDREVRTIKIEYSLLSVMARGHQKIQSQQKAQEKKDKLKKAQGSDQKKAAKAALKYSCPVCKSQMPDPKTFKQHFESKHPKNELPPELQDI